MRALLLFFLVFLISTAGPAPLRAQGAAVDIMVLSPEPGERLPQEDVLVAASFVDRDALVDPGSVVLRVDGRDVTPEAEVGGTVVSWISGQPLPPGPHRVTLEVADRGGVALASSSWAFTVAPDSEGAPAAAGAAGGAAGGAGSGEDRQAGAAPTWTRLQGSATFEGSALSTSGPGSDLRRGQAVVPRLWVNAGGLLGGGWRYSARIHVSGYESSSRQPVNRYRVDVRSDHLDATFGDMNPVLHDLILAGTRVRGVEGDLRAGPGRLTVVWGQSRRAIPGILDPNDPDRMLRSGTYGRSLFAVRPAVGGQTFQVGATVLRARDDLSSIPELRMGTDPLTGTVGTARVNPLPKDNLVGGTDATLRLLDGTVLVQYENALSLLANDRSSGPVTEEQLDSIFEWAGIGAPGVDPMDHDGLFTINASMIPLDPRELTSLAQRARTSWRRGRNILSVEWRSIGGSYYSLGHPALQRDRRGFRIRDSFTLLDDALALSAGLERDRDNLDGIKAATTTSSAFFTTASWQASPRAPALLASFRKGSRENGLAGGQSGALQEDNLALGLGASVPVGEIGGVRTRVELNLSAVDRKDPANPVGGTRDRYYVGGVQGESLDGATDATLRYGVNTTELLGYDRAKTDFHRVSADVRHRFLPRWTATLDGTYTAARSPDEAGELGLSYDRLELLLGGQYEWTESAFVTFTAGIVSYRDERVPERDTRELVTRLRVHQAF